MKDYHKRKMFFPTLEFSIKYQERRPYFFVFKKFIRNFVLSSYFGNKKNRINGRKQNSYIPDRRWTDKD